ncbi:uracil-DNA glycosylase [Rubrobacter aplysinae]|uniref:uracil-DNA glycosylase n=1 Tax=Rubrobacter aplysinae TaxID=909625 RepID=UPI00190FEC1E|nr:uracil-DNA glycosylase [Rubrobacter aplysinae]
MNDLRQNVDREEHVPHFDPLDGGTKARCLFLFETPGPKALESGFASRNNPDESAKNFFELNEKAGLDRRLTASWNIVPWYLGSGEKIRAAKRADINQGLPYLWELLSHLSLEVIVLGGRKAQRVESDIREHYPSIQIEEMWHPSPQSLNPVPQRREEILEVLRRVTRSLSHKDA